MEKHSFGIKPSEINWESIGSRITELATVDTDSTKSNDDYSSEDSIDFEPISSELLDVALINLYKKRND